MWFVRISDDGEQKEMLIETTDEPRVWRYGDPVGPRMPLCVGGVCAIGETLKDCYKRINAFQGGYSVQ